MRARSRAVVMLCAILVAASLVAPLAQSREQRVERAAQASQQLFEEWFGPAPRPSALVGVPVTWPSPPLSFDVEREAARNVAQRWLPQRSTMMIDGAAQYLQSRAVARLFDAEFRKAGAGVDTLPLFGGIYATTFAQLRFDGPTAGLQRDHFSWPAVRVAHAFASLEHLAGQPRLIGALRATLAQSPESDEAFVGALSSGLGQDVGWLFESAMNPANDMSYAITQVSAAPCAPAPCERVVVDVAHRGSRAFTPVEVRVDFADGQSVTSVWDGKEESRAFTFEGPSRPISVRLDPDYLNLLDDDLTDQYRAIGIATNAPVGKWMARWIVWLQDAMLAYTAIL